MAISIIVALQTYCTLPQQCPLVIPLLQHSNTCDEGEHQHKAGGSEEYLPFHTMRTEYKGLTTKYIAHADKRDATTRCDE